MLRCVASNATAAATRRWRACWWRCAPRPPRVTVRLAFEPGDAAQVDFGAEPLLMQPDGQPRRALGIHDDAGAWPAPIRRVRLGSERGHLAGLPSACLRVVRPLCRGG